MVTHIHSPDSNINSTRLHPREQILKNCIVNCKFPWCYPGFPLGKDNERGGGGPKFLKIDKKGAQITYGGLNIPENCTNLRKSAFFKIRIQKINKQGLK